MFGPLIENDIQVRKLNNQERLKQAERYRKIAQAVAGEQRAAQPQYNRIGNLLGRLSFRNRTASTGSAS